MCIRDRLKANAYGLGMLPMADLLRRQGVKRFGVTEPEDAVALRDGGFLDEEILMLRSTAVKEDIEKILSSTATAAIGSYDAAVAVNGMAEEAGMVVDVHVEIDTGMGRYGFEPSELERVLSVFRFMGNLHVTGMFTHFSSAFASPKATRAQYDKLVEMAAKVRQAGFDPGMLHAANSAALFRCDLPSLDGVRIGSAIGGRTTAKGDTGLQKTGRLESQVAEVRWLPAGHGVGYGPAFVTKRPTKIAVIPVGYSDGFMVEKGRDAFRFRDSLRYALGDMAKWLRRKKFYVTVGNRRVRVLGHVGLNHTTVDVTCLLYTSGPQPQKDVHKDGEWGELFCCRGQKPGHAQKQHHIGKGGKPAQVFLVDLLFPFGQHIHSPFTTGSPLPAPAEEGFRYFPATE